MIGKRAALAAHSKRKLVGRNGMANRRPNFAATMHGWQGIHRHLHNAGDFRPAAFAFDGVFDRHLLHTKVFANQWGEGSHGTAFSTAEDSAECRGLLIIGALINVGCERPITLSHGTRSMADYGNVKSVERYRVVFAFVDVEDERNIAHALAGPRRQRRARRDETRAHHVAIAVFEVIARQLPLL